MKFVYTSLIAQSNDGDFCLIRPPEIPITISNGSEEIALVALVDTGAVYTILPGRIARLLSIPRYADEASGATAFGGAKLELVQGEVHMHIEDENEQVDFKVPVCFHEFDQIEEEVAVLGFAGFLEYFTATFEGDHTLLTLTPNSDFAIVAV